MSTPAKKKGTTEESAIVRTWNEYWGTEIARRQPASSKYDVRVSLERAAHGPIEVLSTRPDRGQRLYTLREEDFLKLFGSYEFYRNTPVHIESKRYARFALHTIFDKKFGEAEVSYKPRGKDLLPLIGNPDVYARQKDNGDWFPVREPLTPKVLKLHRAGVITVGTYIVNPPDQARTLVFDIDAHTDDADPDAELEALLGVLDDLLLADEVGVEDSGGGGWHVWVVADAYMSAETLYRIGRGVRLEAGLPKLEVYPKQRQVRDLGNLVKLPGGTHRKTRQPNDFIQMYKPISTARLEGVAQGYPEVGVSRGSASQSIEYPCVFSIQEGVREGGRNTHLFHLATMLRRFSLQDENVETIVRRANERSEDGPLPDEEVDALLASSCNSGPICGQLDEDVHCGEQCILAKHSGLYTRAGNLRYAGDGDKVVIEVATRTDDGKVIELAHPDMEQGRAIIAEPVRRKREDGN